MVREQFRGRGRKMARSVVFLKPKKLARRLSTRQMMKRQQPRSRTEHGPGGRHGGSSVKKVLRQWLQWNDGNRNSRLQ